MLPDHCHRRLDVASARDAGAARELAAGLGEGMLDRDGAGRLDFVVGSLTARLLEHPEGGTLLLRRWARGQGVECIAYDRDGVAANSAPSDGAGAVRAKADRFAAHATPGVGTTTLVRVLRAGCFDATATGGAVPAGAVMVAKPGGTTCADGWFLRGASGPDSGLALVVDGLAGDAAGAARTRRAEAVAAATAPGLSPQMVVGAIRRDAEAGAPGVTAAVLRFDGASVDYTALGTVAGAVVRQRQVTSLAARWAMVGYNPTMPASVHLLWGAGDHVVLHSDGCARLPSLFVERGLHRVDPTLAAAVLLRDGGLWDGERQDDCTVIVLRNQSNA